MVNRRAMLGLVPAIVAIPAMVDQHIDPIARFEGEVEPSGTRTGPILLERSKYVVIGPSASNLSGFPIEANTPCECCAEMHQIDGFAIYTIGCHPAAMARGQAERSTLATFDMTDDAHPVGVDIPNCPGARYAPHVHAPTDFRWV